MAEESFFEYELKLIPKESTQIKLLASLKSDAIDNVISVITNALGLSDTYVLQPLDAEALTDVYHDTNELTLFKEGNCLRVRHSGKDIKITAKISRGTVAGEFKRDEYSVNCDQASLQRHINENFVDFSRTKFPHLSGKKLSPKIIVKNSRRLFEMRPRKESGQDEGFRAKLSFDMYTFVNPSNGRSSNELYELEIEALNEGARSRLDHLSKQIQGLIPNFTPSLLSKYERGVQYFKLNKSPLVQWFNDWPVSPGYNWIMFFLAITALVLGLLAL